MLLSGVKATVDGIPTTARWQVTYDAGKIPAVTAGTSEARQLVCGIPTWEGEILAIGTEPTHLPGDSMSFVGYVGGVDGTPSTHTGFSGTAVVESVSAIASYRANQFYMLQYRIVSDGAGTFGSVTPPTPGAVTAVCPAGKQVTLDGNALDNVLEWQLTLARELIPYVSSGTAGQRKHVEGIFRASLAMTAQLEDEDVPAPGTTFDVRLYTSNSEYWQLDSLMLIGVREYGVDLIGAGQRDQPPQYTLVFEHTYQANKTIKTPGLVTVWP